MCKAGDVLTPEQCRLLQLFGVKQAAFRIHIIAAHFTTESGKGRLEVIKEGASTQPEKAAASVPVSTQRRRKQASAAAAAEQSTAGMEEEQEEAGEDGEEEEGAEDEDESEEFVPEPLQGWGEVAVPSYAH